MNGIAANTPIPLEEDDSENEWLKGNGAAKPIDTDHGGIRGRGSGDLSSPPTKGICGYTGSYSPDEGIQAQSAPILSTETEEPRSPSRRVLTRSATRIRRSLGGISPGRNPFLGSPLNELPHQIGAFTSRNPRTKGSLPGHKRGRGEGMNNPNKEQQFMEKWLEGLGKERKPLALISGCDGTHAARIAIQDEVGRPDIMVIMESDVARRAFVCENSVILSTGFSP